MGFCHPSCWPNGHPCLTTFWLLSKSSPTCNVKIRGKPVDLSKILSSLGNSLDAKAGLASPPISLLLEVTPFNDYKDPLLLPTLHPKDLKARGTHNFWMGSSLGDPTIIVGWTSLACEIGHTNHPCETHHVSPNTSPFALIKIRQPITGYGGLFRSFYLMVIWWNNH